MAFRGIKPASNSLGTLTGQRFVHSPQAEQLDPTNLGCFVIRTLKLPGDPSTAVTSAKLMIYMFGCWKAYTIFGVRMHCEQSRVGKILLS